MQLTDWLVPLGSSLLGALVGALALLLIYRSEAKARERETLQRHAERFETALADLMRQMAALAARLREYDAAQRDWEVRRANAMIANARDIASQAPKPPVEADVWSSYEIAQMIANHDEGLVLSSLGSVIAFSMPLPANDAQGNLTAASGLLRIWRTGVITQGKAIADLNQMEADALARLTGKTTASRSE